MLLSRRVLGNVVIFPHKISGMRQFYAQVSKWKIKADVCGQAVSAM